MAQCLLILWRMRTQNESLHQHKVEQEWSKHHLVCTLEKSQSPPLCHKCLHPLQIPGNNFRHQRPLLDTSLLSVCMRAPDKVRVEALKQALAEGKSWTWCGGVWYYSWKRPTSKLFECSVYYLDILLCSQSVSCFATISRANKRVSISRANKRVSNGKRCLCIQSPNERTNHHDCFAIAHPCFAIAHCFETVPDRTIGQSDKRTFKWWLATNKPPPSILTTIIEATIEDTRCVRRLCIFSHFWFSLFSRSWLSILMKTC